MKAIAYNVLECEKRHLAEANSKVHDLTLISNELNQSTIHYSVGKEAVVISDRDVLDEKMLFELYKIGVRYITSRSHTVLHIDLLKAEALKLHIARVSDSNSTAEIAEHTMANLTQWTLQGCSSSICPCHSSKYKR